MFLFYKWDMEPFPDGLIGSCQFWEKCVYDMEKWSGDLFTRLWYIYILFESRHIHRRLKTALPTYLALVIAISSFTARDHTIFLMISFSMKSCNEIRLYLVTSFSFVRSLLCRGYFSTAGFVSFFFIFKLAKLTWFLRHLIALPF